MLKNTVLDTWDHYWIKIVNDRDVEVHIQFHLCLLFSLITRRYPGWTRRRSHPKPNLRRSASRSGSTRTGVSILSNFVSLFLLLSLNEMVKLRSKKQKLYVFMKKKSLVGWTPGVNPIKLKKICEITEKRTYL